MPSSRGVAKLQPIQPFIRTVVGLAGAKLGALSLAPRPGAAVLGHPKQPGGRSRGGVARTTRAHIAPRPRGSHLCCSAVNDDRFGGRLFVAEALTSPIHALYRRWD